MSPITIVTAGNFYMLFYWENAIQLMPVTLPVKKNIWALAVKIFQVMYEMQATFLTIFRSKWTKTCKT